MIPVLGTVILNGAHWLKKQKKGGGK